MYSKLTDEQKIVIDVAARNMKKIVAILNESPTTAEVDVATIGFVHENILSASPHIKTDPEKIDEWREIFSEHLVPSTKADPVERPTLNS